MPTDGQLIPSVWARQSRKRNRASLSPRLIVAEAIRLLDSEGLEALSMRTLGKRLDAGATSLYRHVANKDELMELVVDEIYGEIELPDNADPGRQGPGAVDRASWRESVVASARNLRATILRHPWLASVLGEIGFAYLGPNVMRLNDRLLAGYEAVGFPLAEADQAISTVAAYVVGTSTAEAAWLTRLARSGQDDGEWEENLRASAEVATKAHPRLRTWFEDYGTKNPRQVREETFEYGLQRVLDGLEVRLDVL